MNKFRIIAILLAIGIFSPAIKGQKLTVDLHSYPTVDRGFSPSFIVPFSGIGLTTNYGQKHKLESSVSFRSLPWGSEIALSEGVVFPLLEKERISVSNTSKIFLGIPLFYNKLSISTALSSEFNLRFNKFHRIYLSAGARYSVNPAYRRISSKFQFAEGLLGLHIVLWK